MKFIYKNNNKIIKYILLFILFVSSITTHIIGELYFFTPNGT